MTNLITNETKLTYPFSSICNALPTHYQLKWSKGNRPIINVQYGTSFCYIKADRQGWHIEVENLSEYCSRGFENGILLKNVDISTKFRENQINDFSDFFKGSNPIISLKKGNKNIAIFDGNVSRHFVGKIGKFIPTSNGGGQGITIIFF